MLKTTENQLNPEIIMLRKRQLIINELTKADYNNLIKDKNNKNNDVIAYPINQPIPLRLDFNYDYSLELEYLEILRFHIYCERFTIDDITAFTKLYIYGLKNHIKEIPEDILNIKNSEIYPGQLADIIAEHLL